MKNKRNERGSALILTLILLLVMSVMAASMMFLAQSETWATMNYRMMSQTRYAAETGIQAAANYLMFTYVPPSTATDQLTSYNYQTVSPVTLGVGSSAPAVVLSSINGESAVYADSAVMSQYANVTKGTLTAGNTTLNFASDAKLIAMRQVKVFGKSQPATVQTWLVKGRGNVVGVQNAQVEVTAILERLVTPMFAYAAFANSSGCSALVFGGGAKTNSYNSASLTANGGTYATPTFVASGGNVGTNGNLDDFGNSVINGSLSTPRTGTGTCSTGNVTALSGTNTPTGGIIELPQPILYPTPDPPSPMPPTGSLSINNGPCGYTGCNQPAKNGDYYLTPTLNPDGITAFTSSATNPTQYNCSTAPATPCTYPDITINAGAVVHLTAGTYNINSIRFNGNASIVVDSGPVVMNIAGTGLGSSTSAVDLTGGSVTNSSLNPSNLQILYGGTNAVKVASGNAGAAMLAYAPNAVGSITGSGDFYGSLIANTITDMGQGTIHYDSNLQVTMMNLGAWMLDSFTWSKF
ncbi:MAG: hypothetical protein LAN71_11820 [Acidobacteriia bacterium]|nr:hypothetical protein [Terriglobia bacterium]